MQPSSMRLAKEPLVAEAILPVPISNPRHVCTIKDDPNVVFMTQLPPFAPFHKRMKRAWRRFTLISESNGRTHEYFHSNSAIFKEKQRHARTSRYKFTIHPFSNFCTYREVFLVFMYTIVFIADPFIGSFMSYLLYDDDWIKAGYTVKIMENALFTINTIMYINVIFDFFIGYVIFQTKTIVLDPAKIATNYLKSYFIFDVVGASPILIIFSRDHISKALTSMVFQLHICRYIRLITVVRIIAQRMRSFQIRDSVIVLTMIVIITIFAIHWCSCFLYVVPSLQFHMHLKLKKTSWTDRALIDVGDFGVPYKTYLQAVLVTMSHFYGTGIGMYSTTNFYEHLILAAITVLGFMNYLVVVALILQLFGVVNISETKYEELRRQVDEYLMIKKISPAIKKRMDSYYEYKFKKRFFMEHEIMNSLSEHLRCEITLHCCKNLIENVLIFQGAPKAAIGRVLGMVSPEVFLAGDRIIGIDDLKENIYFIAWGTAAVYINNKELVHLEDGDYFGDSAEKMSPTGEKNNYEVYAIEITELFCIPYMDMMKCLMHYPQVLDRLDSVSGQKSRLYAKLLDTEVNISEDILANLRRGNILEKSKKRH